MSSRYRPVGFYTPRESVSYGGRPPSSEPAPSPVIPRTQIIDLSVARTDSVLPIQGNILWAIAASATDATMTVKIEKGGERSDGMPCANDFRLAGVAFDRVLITNAVQAGKTLTLAYMNDPNPGDVEFGA